MKTHTAEDWEDLETRLQDYVCSQQNPTAIIGGHYPLYDDARAGLEPNTEIFGIFSRFTFDLACKLVKFGKQNDRQTSLLLLVDDHSQMRNPQWYQSDAPVDPVATAVAHYFESYNIPAAYNKLLKVHGLSDEVFMRTQTGNTSFQETTYRRRYIEKAGIDPGCSGEYRLLVEELAQRGVKTVLAFIPLRCKTPTCRAITEFNTANSDQSLTKIHIYLSSEKTLETPDELLTRMRRDGGIPIIYSQ